MTDAAPPSRASRRLRPPETPGVADVLRTIWENLPLLAFGLLVGIGAGLLAQRLIPKAYEASAKFIVGEVPYYDAKNRADSETERQLVETLILSLASRDIQQEVARALGVPPARIGFTGLDLPRRLEGATPEANVRISTIKDSRIGEIAVESQSPQFAATVANAVLDQLQYFNLVGGRLKNLRLSMELAKAKADSTLAELVKVSGERNRLQQENAELDNHVRRGLPLTAFPTFATDPTLNNLKTQLILTESEYESISATATRGSRLSGKHAELIGLRAQTQSHVQRLADSLRAEYEIIKTQEKDVERQLTELKDRIDRLAERISQLSQSLSDPKTMRAVAAAPGEEPVGAASVFITIDRATPREKPIRPKLWLNLLLGVVFGSALGAGLTGLRLILDTRLKSARQIEQRARVPALALLPRHQPLYKGIRNRTIFDHPDYPVGLGFLRGELLRAGALDAAARIVGFTPARDRAGDRAGSSPLVANLAILLAQAEQRTLVVDLHFDAPRQADLLGIRSRQGLSEWLVTNDPVDDFISYSAVRELAVLTPGAPNRDLDDLLSRRPLLDSLPGLREKWDFILLDAPSIVSDWTTMLSLPAGSPLIIAARFGRTTIDQLIATAEKAQVQNWNVMGAVLQDCPARLCPRPRPRSRA